MRLSTRLFLGYVVVLLVVGVALAVGLGRATERAMLRYTADVLAGQVEFIARGPVNLRRVAALTAESEGALLPPQLLVVDEQNRVIRSSVHLPGLTSGQPLSGGLARLADAARRNGRAGMPIAESNVVAGAARLGLQRGSGGFVIILFREVRDLQPAIRLVRQRVLFWTLAGLLVATVVAGLIGRALTRRLARVQAAAAAVAEGELSRRVSVGGNDEVAELAESFNHMANRLQETIEGLRRSEQVRRDLAASLAHELRTPITSMRGFAEALRDGVVPDPEQQKRYLGIIAAESARLGRLVQDLFDFATLESGQQVFRMQPFRLGPWLREYAAGAGARVEEAGLRFELVFPPEGPLAQAVVVADPDRIAQVLTNLLDNALRHAPPGSAVRIEAAAQGEEAVRISVSDQGPGIAAAEQERIWERFYRGLQERPGAGGAGLGLAIVKSIVLTHGGQVGVESAPGSGARFWFTLPIERR